MRRLRGIIAAITLSIAGLLAFAAPAGAITGGAPDGNNHPSVALIAFYSPEDDPSVGLRFRCSATLVTPTVLVTAAHCTTDTMGKTFVTFVSDIATESPSGLPRALDDAGTGSSLVGYNGTEVPTNPNLANAPYYYGTAYTHPNYSDFTDMKNWNDVGVIVLDKPVTGIAPTKIAPLGTLDKVAQPALNSTLFRVVGYGTEVRKPASGPQKPSAESYPLIRRYADAPGQKLTPQILQVNGNIHDTRGTGGSCFGDSGGPTFYDPTQAYTSLASQYQVTVTSYGYTDNCRYLDGLQRIDIKVVQDWLATFGVLPATM